MVLVVALLTYGALGYYYYGDVPDREEVVFPDTGSIDVPEQAEEETGIIGARVSGRVVFDAAHDNDFTVSEMYSLLESLSAQGGDYLVVEDAERLAKELSLAKSLVIISPRQPYTKEEIALLKGFIEKGGRILLLADPTRESRIDSVSSEFGVFYSNDYLYRMDDNAGNYRHIYVGDFEDTSVTKDLERIVLVTASSLVTEDAVAFTDTEVTSSTKGKGRHKVISLTGESIISIGDQSFIEPPFSRYEDNAMLISNLARFLLESIRSHTLEDFPHFYTQVNIRYSNDSLIEDALEFKSILLGAGIESTISMEESDEAVFIGFVDESDKEMSEISELVVDNAVRAGGVEYNLNNTAIVYLKEKGMYILSQDHGSITDIIALMREGNLRYNLVSENLAVLPYSSPSEPIQKESAESSVEAL